MNSIRDPTTGRSWTGPRELMQHIEASYHGYLRLTLPILEHLADSIASQLREPASLIERLQRQVKALTDDLEMHMARQEYRLFPQVRQLRRPVGDTAWVSQPADNVQELMDRSVRESCNALDVLQRVQQCLSDPAWAGNGRELEQLDSDLRELQENLVEHFHVENDILFPAVREMVGAQALTV